VPYLLEAIPVGSTEIFAVLRKDHNTLLDAAKNHERPERTALEALVIFSEKRQRDMVGFLRLAPGTGIAPHLFSKAFWVDRVVGNYSPLSLS